MVPSYAKSRSPVDGGAAPTRDNVPVTWWMRAKWRVAAARQAAVGEPCTGAGASSSGPLVTADTPAGRVQGLRPRLGHGLSARLRLRRARHRSRRGHSHRPVGDAVGGHSARAGLLRPDRAQGRRPLRDRPGRHIVAHECIEIGDDVWTGPYVYITDQNHGYEDPGTPIGLQLPVNRPVSIGAGPGWARGRSSCQARASAVTWWSRPLGGARRHSRPVRGRGSAARVIREHTADGWRPSAGPVPDPLAPPEEKRSWT